MNRTLVLCKPDAVERGLVGEIISRFERRGLHLAAAELRIVEPSLAEKHYAEHAERPFFGDLIEFITRGPVMAMVVEGPPDTWQVVRKMMGATNPQAADSGTIRADLAIDMGENLVHGSDSAESAALEIALWFPHLA